MKILDELYI